jgi:outer membrane protein assembly factor BamB
MEAPAAVAAGEVLTVTLQNTGGVTATVYGTLVLADRRSATVAETPFYLTVPANGSARVFLPVPAQLRSDLHVLRLEGTDQLSQAFVRRRIVGVQGLQVELDSRTDQPAYLASDTITTTSTITPNTALAGAALRLRVLGTPPPAGPWDGWRARLADGGHSNFVAQTAAGPFQPGWSASPGTGVAPLAIDDLVIMLDPTCGNSRVTAVDSLDSSVRWQSEPLPNYPYALAANSQTVYVHTYPSCPSSPGEGLKLPLDLPSSELLALDAATGAVLWQVSLATTGELLASDQAVAIQDDNRSGFRLLDPATGITHTVLSTVTHPLLVGGVLYDLDEDDQLAAYDSATGTVLWSTAVLTDSELIAANTGYVLTFQSYDPVTFSTVNRLSVYTSGGAYLGDVELSQSPYAPWFVLRDDALFYLYVDTGGSTRSPEDIVSTVYEIDLAALSESVFYTSEDEIMALAGSGEQLHLVDSYAEAVISLDANGAVVDQSDISSLGGYFYDGLAVHQQGLLVLSSGDYQVYALLGSGPVSGGEGGGRAVEATSVLREDWLPVDGSGVLSLAVPLTTPNLADDPRARGLLYLEGVLFAAEPAAASPAERQRLASSVYPFTIDNAVTSLTLHSDRPVYRRNVPGYAMRCRRRR